MLFCTSLRKRSEWAAVPAKLLAEQQVRWQEQSLETHDLAIQVPRHNSDHREVFRLLLLSASDVERPGTAMSRIERLYHQTGGRQVGIIFLLQEKSPNGNGTIPYMNIQCSLLSAFDMPTIPLFSTRSLLDTLFKFQRQLVSTRAEIYMPRARPDVTLLPYCFLKPPMPEHPKNLLSDVVHTMGELAGAATTLDGQKCIRSLVSEPGSTVAEDIIEFWGQEYLV
ncbi:hypothetical protein LSUB1_G001054 [Lachnellula subtilissima]|uniref:Uncharacterized protein n=1 Tax=Lachnellula subtilissima TaxID=602034 RepID=A0A8H8RUV6_9HELO|nr:hypothetical protein LSUB1_G001054 [Lachnellula subtilissima]